ncbi:hypothetical protein NQD34_010407 [Periophthalmus magnuspinnatus]|nr:hypothetical protein NQD34_010407 [Periophthalmus magnuspinnatus]
MTMTQQQEIQVKLRQEELDTQFKDLQNSTEQLQAERQQVEELRENFEMKAQDIAATITHLNEEIQKLQNERMNLETKRQEMEDNMMRDGRLKQQQQKSQVKGQRTSTGAGEMEEPWKDLDRKQQETQAEMKLLQDQEGRRKLQTQREQLDLQMKEFKTKSNTLSLLDEDKIEEEVAVTSHDTELKQDELKQTEELQSRYQTEVVHTHVDLDSAWEETREQRDQLSQDRLKLQKQQEQMDMELKRRQDQLHNMTGRLSYLRGLLQQNRNTLQLHIQDMDKLRQKLTALDQDRDKMADCIQLLEGQKNSLKDTLSLFIGQKQRPLQERQQVETLISEVKKSSKELDQKRDTIDGEKEEMQKTRNYVHTFTDRLGKLLEDLEVNKTTLQRTRSELMKKSEQTNLLTEELKRVNLRVKELACAVKSKKDKLDMMNQEPCVDSVTSEEATLVRKEESTSILEQLTQDKISLAQERDMFIDECKQREEDLKQREGELANKMAVILQLSLRLKQLTQHRNDAAVKKIQQMEDSSDRLLKLCLKVKQNSDQLYQEKNRIKLYSKLLQGEVENLGITSATSSRRHIEKEEDSTIELEEHAMDKITQTEQYEPIRPDLRKYNENLQKQTLDLKAANHFLENTLEELRCNKNDLTCIMAEVKMENASLKHMADSVQKSKEELKTFMNMLQVRGSIAEVQEQGQTLDTEIDKESYKQMEASAITEQTRPLKLHLSQLKEIFTSREKKIQLNQEQIVTVTTVLKQKLAELNKLKEDLASYSKAFEMEKTALVNILSTKLEKLSDDLSIATLQKQDFEKLQNERKEVESLRETVKKECEDLEILKLDIQSQNGLLQKTKQDLQDERDKMEIRKAELVNREEKLQEDMELLNQMKNSIDSEKATLQTEKQQLEVKVSQIKSQEDNLKLATKSMEELSVKFKQSCQLRDCQMEENIKRMQLNKAHILQLNRDTEKQFEELKNVKNEIVYHYETIRKQKSQQNIIMCDKAVQTEESTRKQEKDLVSPSEIEQKKDRKSESKQSSVSSSLESLIVSTDEKVSKKDYLRQLWKETAKERKEIDKMKQRGQQLKSNLETRLKNIQPLLKRPIRKDVLMVEESTSHHSQKQDEKYSGQLQKLGQTEKLTVQEMKTRTLKTSDKANQTSLDSLTEQVITEGAEAYVPDPFTGLLYQIQHYCYSCCCQCCVCCQQACPENNNNNRPTQCWCK